MKKHTPKKRYIFLVTAIAVLILGFIVYTFFFGQNYRFTQPIEDSNVDFSTLEVKSSDESVIKVKSFGQGTTYNGRHYVYFDLESGSSGNATLDVFFVVEGGIVSGDCHFIRSFVVLPSGMIYDISYRSFASSGLIVPLFLLIVLLILTVMTVTFAEKLRHGDFSYSMVYSGGVILFLLISCIVILLDYRFWGAAGNMFSFTNLPEQLVRCGKRFLRITDIPNILLAVSLAVSNIWLIKKEGFRIQNALGILMGMLFIAGFIAVRLTDQDNTSSIEMFYLRISLNLTATYLFCYCQCMLISTMFCAVAATRFKPAPDLDYIIILGCAIRRDGTPTPLLLGRVRRAFEFDKEQFEKTGKHAKFVPSGGQGGDEVISEAESMKRCLVQLGVPEDRIVKEDRSVNTYQNMEFSKKVIESDCGSENCNIGFSTTNYHVFRGYTKAEKLGMKVKGLSAKTKLYFFPNAFIREFIGVLWEKKVQHILFATILAAVMVVLNLILVRFAARG